MANLGHLSLVFAAGFAAYALMVGILGFWTKREQLVSSAMRSFLVNSAWILMASLIVVILLTQDSFHHSYVWENSNRALPWYFKLAALWGGQAGSLLFWNLILNAYAVVVLWQNHKKDRWVMACVTAVFAASTLFFTLLHLFVANPFSSFHMVAGGTESPFIPPDGKGLNPLLQHPAMVIHPPMLYLGYIGFAVPFAFAIAALAAGQLGNLWIKTVRRWTLATWLFLGVGVVLGARWAYVELGWGGYWGWDPVENASLMPWLAGTAYLHSVMVQERQGMLKAWNMVLIILCYILCITGTFLTRSGVVSSVHSFAQSDIGWYFLVFIALLIGLSAWLLALRWKELRKSPPLESVVSRESSFLFNNLILLCACFAVLWGTLFPVLSEAITGEKIVVGAPFFNKVTIPIALLLLLLTGVGPFFAWRRTSLGTLKKAFLWPTITSVATAAALVLAGITHFYAVMCFALSVFVTHTVLREFFKGASARAKVRREAFPKALWRMAASNKRRYGGFLVHLGIVIIFCGIAGEAFKEEGRLELAEGQRGQFGRYQIALEKLEAEDNANYVGESATVQVYDAKGRQLARLMPEKRFYKTSEQPTSEVALHTGAREDLYLVLAEVKDNGVALIQVYVNPLVNLIWLGTLIAALGTLFAMGREDTKR